MFDLPILFRQVCSAYVGSQTKGSIYGLEKINKISVLVTAFRLAEYDRSISICPRHPEMLWEVAKRSAANWRHGSSTPTVGLTEPPSLPATVLSRSDCDWTGVSLSSLWVMAKSGAARYFESIRLAHHLSIARCLSAGLGVPLHTLMLITITKRKYLANGYSIVKELSRFRHTKENRVRVFLFSHPVARGNIQFSPLLKKLF